ncbi:helix-turn-helix transcriptional regulator [Curtobacterium aetherium]|uniref:helix-turn-helix transcriptional regulator n=1 Tax=Curtobacterium aetherium TaxID=2841594 RepID=UPI003B519020
MTVTTSAARPDPDRTTSTGTEAQPETVVAVSGTDTASAIRDLAGLYAGRSWHSAPVDHDYWYKYVGVGDETMSIRRSQMHGTLRGDVAVEDEVVVQWIDSGRGVLDVGRDAVAMQVGVPVLVVTGQRFAFDYEDWDQRLVHLDRALVLDVAAEEHLVDGTLAFDRTTTPSAGAVRQWRGSVAGAVGALRAEGASSLAWHEAQRDVVRSLFGLYPVEAERRPVGWGDRRTARLRSAVEFLHEHAAEPVTVSDVARASAISVRALQESFQRSLGRTPMTYLRDVRLRHTRDDLVAADPGSTTVGEVAMRWGFSHMGRFSNEYLRRFGEYPRHTLRR